MKVQPAALFLSRRKLDAFKVGGPRLLAARAYARFSSLTRTTVGRLTRHGRVRLESLTYFFSTDSVAGISCFVFTLSGPKTQSKFVTTIWPFQMQGSPGWFNSPLRPSVSPF
jgi:hypothetical protein